MKDGQVVFKARLTIAGNQQDPETINPDHRASPTVDSDAIRLILAELANVPGAKFITFDFVRAYLQAKLPKDYKPIYMRVMRGFEDDFPDKNTVFLLGVNMYGLVTAAYYWWLELCRGMERRVGKGATRKVVFGGKTHRAAPFTLQCTLTMP